MLNKYDVGYEECAGCGSLQTQQPTWLAEAYSASWLAAADVGAAQRVHQNHAAVLRLAQMFKLNHLLDFGGGDGLLCRLLRDRGLQAFTSDGYSVSGYAQTFVGSLSEKWDMISAFEVVEHLPDPRASFGEIFQPSPRFVLISTEAYNHHDADWWYLAPSEGQHVFFYSCKALEGIAARYGYHLTYLKGYFLFSKEKISPWRRRITAYVTSAGPLKRFRATLPFTETTDWINADHEAILGRRH